MQASIRGIKEGVEGIENCAMYTTADLKEMNKKKYKLVFVAPHPVPYHAPLFRETAKLPNIDSIVLYQDNITIRPTFVSEFKAVIQWDIPLTEGYECKFLKNYSKKPLGGFFARINPSIISEFWKGQYDVTLCQGYNRFSDWITFLAAKITGTKIIWRGEATLRRNIDSNPIKVKLKKWLLPMFFKACDAVMYSCTGNRQYLLHYGANPDKMFPIPCSVDNTYFENERRKYQDKSTIRETLRINKDDFVIIFSGRFTARKRPLDIVKAIGSIDNNDRIVALFLGDGLQRRNMEKYAQEHHIKAVFVGFQNQSEVAKYYSIADVAVVISDYDPSPKAMNEAMNFELPIIVTDVVGTAYDLVMDGENGFIVNVGDIDSIATKIDYFNKNRAVAKAMGKKSWEIVKDWNFQKDVKGIEKAIQFVMNN